MSELKERFTPSDVVLLRENLKRHWVERLLGDLDRVHEAEAAKKGTRADTREDLERLLGHPFRDLTMEEHRHLSRYVDDMERALRESKPTPMLRPLPR